MGTSRDRPIVQRPGRFSRERVIAADDPDMLITAALALALVSVPLLGGRLSRLAALRFRAGWIAALALAIQVVVIEVVPGGDGAWHRIAHLASYALLFAFVAVNLRGIPFLWVIALGGAGNAAAIAANDGVMPARPEALAAAGVQQAPGEFLNSTAVDDARLAWLGDVFAVPASWPVSGVFSAGDVLLIAGVLLCLHVTCGRRRTAPLAPA